MALDTDEEWRSPKPLEWSMQQDGGKAAKARSFWGKWVSQFNYSFHKVSGSLEENWDGQRQVPRKGTHYLVVDNSEGQHSAAGVRTHLPGL